MSKSRSNVLRALFALLVVATMALGGCTAAEDDAASSGASASSALPAAKQATDALRAASAMKEAADVRVSRAVTRATPMLTDAQIPEFVAALQGLPEVQTASRNYIEAASNLATELRRLLADNDERERVLNGIYMTGDSPIHFGLRYGPNDLFEAYALLAETPSATAAVEFATRLLNHDRDLVGLVQSERTTTERILAPALPYAYLEQLIATGTNASATSQLARILDAGGNGTKAAGDFLVSAEEAAGRTVLGADAVRIGGVSIGSSLKTVAGVMAIWELGANILNGNNQAALRSFIDGAPTAIEGLGSAITLYRRVVLGADTSALATRLGALAGRLAGGISAVTAVINLLEASHDWNVTTADKVRIAADIVGLGAGVLVLVGTASTGGIAAVLGAVAGGIHLLANFVENRALERQERVDLAAALPAIGLNAVVVTRMIEANASKVEVLRGPDVELSATDLQWFIGAYEGAVDNYHLPAAYFGLIVSKMIFGLDGAEVGALLRATVRNESDATKIDVMLLEVLATLENPEFNGRMTKSTALAYLDREAAAAESSLRIASAARRLALQNARAYLATR